MATQIVIANGDSILLDNSFNILWADKGNAMPALPDTVHYVIWNDLTGQNEIQSKAPSTGMMTGNTDLNATSDAVGSTTIAALLTWGETRKGQIEAARSLGLKPSLVFLKVTLPQAIRIITPALMNQGIYILKMSSLISVIGLGDLTRRANELIVTTYRPLEIYSFLVLEYLLLILIASFFVRKLEKKFEIK